MSRYIDADAALKRFEEMHGDESELLNCYNADWVVSFIETQPTADVQEVKHGEWIEDRYANAPCVCSCCGAEPQYVSKFNETFDYDWEENLQHTGYEEIREYIKTPYCSQCGAKMDAKE